jgi:hypothetical protein
LPSTNIAQIRFEVKHSLGREFERPANLDAEITYGRGPLRAAAIECKFGEPYGGRPHSGLSSRHLGWWLWTFLAIAVWIAIAFWPARVAARKGHSFLGYFLFSLVFFPAALIVAYMVSDKSRYATA